MRKREKGEDKREGEEEVGGERREERVYLR